MFKNKNDLTVQKFVNHWFSNKFSVYHDPENNGDVLKKEFGNMRCISSKIKELSYYDIFIFVRNKYTVIAVQNNSFKNYDEMDIYNDAILLIFKFEEGKFISEQKGQVYVYKHPPFSNIIKLLSLNEIKKTFKNYNAIELSTGKKIMNFRDLDQKEEYIFISKKPLSASIASSHILLRYSPTCIDIIFKSLYNSNAIWPFK